MRRLNRDKRITLCGLVSMNVPDSQHIIKMIRIYLGWAAYGKIKYIFRSKVLLELMSGIDNKSILLVITYGSKTWILSEKIMSRLQLHQTAV